MRPTAILILLALQPLACGGEEPPEAVEAADSALSAFDGSFATAWTDDARVNYQERPVGGIAAGATVRLSTQYFGGWTARTDQFPYLRLGYYDQFGQWREVARASGRYPKVAATDNHANLIYTAPRSQRLHVRIGCMYNGDCSGAVGRSVDFDSNGELTNVPWSYDRMVARASSRTGFWWNGLMQDLNDLGTTCGWDWDCHNQGMTRLRTGGDGSGPSNWLMFTRNEAANLYFVQIGSAADGPGPWAQNAAPPPPSNLIRHRKDTQWDQNAGTGSYEHAGGIQASGRYVLVGVEDNNGGAGTYLRLWDVADPMLPSYRGGQFRSDLNAAAIAMAKIGGWSTAPIEGLVPADRWLLAIAGKGSETLHFSTKMASVTSWLGQFPTGWSGSIRWSVKNCRTTFQNGGSYRVCEADDAAPGVDKLFHAYQHISLIAERSAGGRPGRVFLLGTTRVYNRDDVADLFEVSSYDFGERPAGCPANQFYCLKKVRGGALACNGGCNFLGAAGTFIDADGERLMVYGQEHDKSESGDWQTFKEF